jgi:RimJ/RimL family protein N-acetyltransferase
MTGIRLVRDTRENAAEIAYQRFMLINRNRIHLSRHGDTTAANYPDQQSVLDRILDPPTGVVEWRYSIMDADTGEMVGFIRLTRLSTAEVEIGYWLGAEYQGRGYMLAAVRELTRQAVEDLEFERVVAWVHLRNNKSQRALTRNGYWAEGLDPERPGFLKLFYTPPGPATA